MPTQNEHATKRVKKKLTVTDQRVIATWPNKGGETTLYEVTAVDENGAAIEAPLRSFAELELGVLLQYEIEPYEHPQHGKSWTVHRPRQNTSARVTELEKTVQELADRISALEERITDGTTGDRSTRTPD